MENKKLAHLINIAIKDGVSDLHLSSGHHPTIRSAGSLMQLIKEPVLSMEDTESFVTSFLTEKEIRIFFEKQEIDFSYKITDSVRLRGNAFFQKDGIGIALRVIPSKIKTTSELNLPPILDTFSRKKQGFFLVVGPVGQGKSTTLAAMIDLINRERAEHIVTIEDPIEYIFKADHSLIEQREVNINTKNFSSALRSAFRQDVDVMMLGEMRDPETIAATVTAGETGHLVFSTLHTNNASQTIDRIIDSSPPGSQQQMRVQLASSLLGIFSQRLVPRVSGGLIPAYELLINNKAVASLIRDGRTHEIDVAVETGSKDGMIDMNKSLVDLVRRGEISPEQAHLYSLNPKSLSRLL